MMLEKKELDFSFTIIDGQIPEFIIDGKRLHVITCFYSWTTSTYNHVNIPCANVVGCIDGGYEPRVFKLLFNPKKCYEIL